MCFLMVTQSEKDYNGGWKINEENDENVNMSEPASMAPGSQSASTPIRVRPQIEGLSHGLRKCPPDTFLPRLRRGRPFESCQRNQKQDSPQRGCPVFGAADGTRTRTVSLPRDFKSPVSTDFTTAAWLSVMIAYYFLTVNPYSWSRFRRNHHKAAPVFPPPPPDLRFSRRSALRPRLPALPGHGSPRGR